MKVCNLKISNFRGIREADLHFPNHAVLIGDNNTGKSTIFEALDLVLGPDRMNKRPVIDEHDFFQGEYLGNEGEASSKIQIEVTIISLTDEQKTRFGSYIEWWDDQNKSLCDSQLVEVIDKDTIQHALRVSFIGKYDAEEMILLAAPIFLEALKKVMKQCFLQGKINNIVDFYI